MSLLESGRVCLKTAGREAGKICVVLDKVDNDFVLVTGPRVLSGVRKRKCNISHLEPLEVKLKVKGDSSDEDIMDLFKKEGDLLKKFNLSLPSAADIKKMETQRNEKEKLKSEKPKEQPKKEKTVTISDLAAEKAKLLEQEKGKKPASLTDLTAETKKLEPSKKKEQKEKK